MENKRILVVEDEAFLQDAIKTKLESEGYDVVVANNGEDALNSLNTKPDLIWLDLYMPKFDGVQFLEELQKHPESSQTPVIVVTVSQGQALQAQKIQGVNIAEFLVKSDYSLKALIEKVEAHLGTS